MALNVLAEAVLRLEHKLDVLLRHFQAKSQPMHFIGMTCPICHQSIDYLVDVQHQVVVRRCGCKTGKIPSTIPLSPVGDSNGQATSSARPLSRSSLPAVEPPSERPADPPRGKAR